MSVEPKISDEAMGVDIRRSVGNDTLVLLDPLLLVDHLRLAPGAETVGFPKHPHRGIETYTYVLRGAMRHRDSLGNEDEVRGNSAQWMKAGNGIFHEEMLVGGDEGTEALQLWFNMPFDRKGEDPDYASVVADEIPEVTLGWGRVRVVSGEKFGVRGLLGSVGVNPICLDVQLGAGQSVEILVAYRDTTVVYVFGGEVEIGGETIVGPRLVVLGSGDFVLARAGGDEVRFFVVSAAALNQPVMQYRSLVMTTVDEMGEAVRDLSEGRFTRHEDRLG